MLPDTGLGPSGSIAMVAVLVGALVKLLKTKKAEEWLTMLPIVKPIPKPYVPWLAIGLGIVITMVDAKLNGGLATWKAAFSIALTGAISGGFAVAGHETVVKTPARVAEYRASMRPPADKSVDVKVSMPPDAAVPKDSDDKPPA